MPRLNVYVPDDVHELAARWRDRVNLSEICARAIREELDAAEGHRSFRSFFDGLRPPSAVEQQLVSRFGLAAAVVGEVGRGSSVDLRESLGQLAANYLDRMICDGAHIAIAGGRQMWCTVRQLTPRRIRSTIYAMGVHQADPELLHTHPNTLATLLWLLYSPRSNAHVIGTETGRTFWSQNLPAADHPKYFVLASCGRLDPRSSFAKLIGDSAMSELQRAGAAGDFAYVFLRRDGEPFSIGLGNPSFALLSGEMRTLARRADAQVILVAGGPEKVDLIARVVDARMCNVLITDEKTARHLLNQHGGLADDSGACPG